MRRNESSGQTTWQKVKDGIVIVGGLGLFCLSFFLFIQYVLAEGGYEPAMTEEEIYYKKFVSLARKIYTEKCNNEYREMVDLIKFVTKNNIPASAIEEAKRQLAKSK